MEIDIWSITKWMYMYYNIGDQGILTTIHRWLSFVFKL